ncbi:MAG TPA: alginate lyase family protein [Candidatus Kapabacteria bacterium]|nr:alginate lyase family protein [Candidatus Kapabacteria bacterium]
MTPATNFRVLNNYVRSRVWAYTVQKGIVKYNDADILGKMTGGKEWEKFWEDLTKEFSSRFYFSPRNQKDFFLQALQSFHSYEDILEDANNAVSRTFDVLGSGDTPLGTPIDWSKDFVSGARWGKSFYTDIRMTEPSPHADIKIPWEIGRFQFLPWLGKAYWVSHSRRYSDAFKAFIEEWIDGNPFCIGIQWGNAMEVAIRACNWIAGAAFFLEEKTIDQNFWRLFCLSLWQHGIYIEHNLEITRRSGNHLIANYTGLVFIGNFFRHTAQGKQWLSMGVKGIEEEILRQISTDGVNYEKSISYHRFVAEMCIDVMLLCRNTHTRFSEETANRIEKMCEFAMHYSRADHSAPNIGDADNGRLFRFRAKEDFNDHSSLLSTAAVVFERSDFKKIAGNFSEDSLWLLGTAGLEKFRALDDSAVVHSQDFPAGGFYSMRSGDAHCMIDAGELGKNGWGGHGHNDTFSFEYWLGEPVIVDSGTFCYLSDAEQRTYFRSTVAHNTIMIDETEIAEFSGPFKIAQDLTNPNVIAWNSSGEEDILEAEHYAYTRLSDPAIHRRKFAFSKTTHRLAITDTIAAKGMHTIALSLHFAPGVRVEQKEKNTLQLTGTKQSLIVTSSHEWQLEPCEISRSYGVKESSTKSVCKIRANCPVTLETIIQPISL